MPSFSSTDELNTFATTLAGQYEVEREIGRGGMGVVYLARDLRLDRMVAIKTLPAQLAEDAGIRERFLREARTAARLTHPNIVPIHRADEIGGQVFFVMGFVDGDSLAAKLSGGALSPRDALPILRDVAGALGYAHKHGVIHRDVKTENILLDSSTDRAMVTDFGIARVSEASPLTATGQVLGTVYYLSPEQVSGDDVDARSDIYALGVVGYAMLAGKFPFDGPLASAVLVAHVMKQPLPLSAAAPHVPPSLATIIDRCLAKDRTYRFQSCAELDAALLAAKADADRVTDAASVSRSPLVSDTEAQAVFKRAAELQDATSGRPRPVFQQPRDAEKDAKRTSGFKTTDLRSAAEEAGIGSEFMEHALAERGLRPAPPSRADRRPANTVFDLTKPSTLFRGNPTETVHEMVIQGEIPEEDYDLMLNAIAHLTEHDEMTGAPASVGRTLTWNGRTSQKRELMISIIPRGGRTTIQVKEMLRQPVQAIYGGVMGAGGMGVGGMAAGLLARGTGGGGLTVLLVWAGVAAAASLIARVVVDDYTKKRKDKAQALLEALGSQAREIARSVK